MKRPYITNMNHASLEDFLIKNITPIFIAPNSSKLFMVKDYDYVEGFAVLTYVEQGSNRAERCALTIDQMDKLMLLNPQGIVGDAKLTYGESTYGITSKSHRAKNPLYQYTLNDTTIVNDLEGCTFRKYKGKTAYAVNVFTKRLSLAWVIKVSLAKTIDGADLSGLEGLSDDDTVMVLGAMERPLNAKRLSARDKFNGTLTAAGWASLVTLTDNQLMTPGGVI